MSETHMNTKRKPRNEKEIKRDEAHKSPPAADDTNRKSDEIRKEQREKP
jgi:hypothetical protein